MAVAQKNPFDSCHGGRVQRGKRSQALFPEQQVRLAAARLQRGGGWGGACPHPPLSPAWDGVTGSHQGSSPTPHPSWLPPRWARTYPSGETEAQSSLKVLSWEASPDLLGPLLTTGSRCARVEGTQAS